MKRVAINGFGRIGRAYLRLARGRDDITVVAINDLHDAETVAYLLRFDSVYGKFPGEVGWGDNALHVDGAKIPLLSERDPGKIPWGQYEVDVVIEATGVFADYGKAHAHIDAGAKKVIVTAPVKGDPPEQVQGATILVGVNTEKAKTCTVTSNASCTTNAVGIPMKTLDEAIGIESAVLNTVHGYTSSQQLVDNASRKKGNFRIGRAAAHNVIPTTTGAAIATTKVLTSLEGRFDALALRVPVISGSIADITFVAKKQTSVEEVNAVLKNARSELFATTEEQVVSSDILGEPFVAIADLSMTRVVNGNLVKVLFWYDNEMGYTQSLIKHTREI